MNELKRASKEFIADIKELCGGWGLADYLGMFVVLSLLFGFYFIVTYFFGTEGGISDV